MGKSIRLYLRKGKNANGEYLYFFSRSGKLVFYIDIEKLKQLLAGERDWVSIVGKKNRKVEERESNRG